MNAESAYVRTDETSILQKFQPTYDGGSCNVGKPQPSKAVRFQLLLGRIIKITITISTVLQVLEETLHGVFKHPFELEEPIVQCSAVL